MKSKPMHDRKSGETAMELPSQNEQVNPSPTPRPRCSANTAKGDPCRNPARANSEVCGAHAGKAGRPPLTPAAPYAGGADGQTYGETAAAIARIGMHRHRIARRMKMSPTVLHSWFERGEADLEQQLETDFARFVLMFWQAESAFVSDQLKMINDAAKDDWRAAVKALELVLPDEYGQRARLEHTGSVNVSIVQDHADQLVAILGPFLADLNLTDAQMSMVPDLIEEHFTPLEGGASDD